MAYVDRTTFSSGPTAVANITPTMPTFSAGDCLVLVVATQGGASQTFGGVGAWTAPTNGRVNNPNGNLEVLAVYYIPNATGSETAPTITLSSSRRVCGSVSSWSGRSATPVATDHATAGAAATNCSESTGITVTDPSSDILFIAATANFVTYSPPATPGTWTERVDTATDTVGATQNSSHCLHSSTQPAGATGAVTSVQTGSQPFNAYLLELAPAGAVSGQPILLRRAAGRAPGVWSPGRGG